MQLPQDGERETHISAVLLQGPVSRTQNAQTWENTPQRGRCHKNCHDCEVQNGSCHCAAVQSAVGSGPGWSRFFGWQSQNPAPAGGNHRSVEDGVRSPGSQRGLEPWGGSGDLRSEIHRPAFCCVLHICQCSRISWNILRYRCWSSLLDVRLIVLRGSPGSLFLLGALGEAETSAPDVHSQVSCVSRNLPARLNTRPLSGDLPLFSRHAWGWGWGAEPDSWGLNP